MLPKQHFLDLEDGHFKRTSAGDLDALFQSMGQSPSANHIVVYFHGGLVSRASAHIAALGLKPFFDAGGAYPVFFVWNSDLKTTLTRSLDEIAQEEIFNRLLRRVIQFAVGKLMEVIGARGGTLQLDSLKDIPTEPTDLEAYADAKQKARGAGAPLTELTVAQKEQIRKELAEDKVIRDQSLAIAAGLRAPSDVEREMATQTRGGPAVRASTHTRMSPGILKRIAEESPQPDTRGLTVLATVAIEGVKIVVEVVQRFIAGTDHGVHATAVEEILRRLYIDSLGTLTWTMIKKDTANAFGNDPALHGGTAFAQHLAQWWQPGRRLTLIGHSTGAIYVGHLLQQVDPLLPAQATADVIFLAPACTFAFLHERLPLFRRRVANFRMFGLSEPKERGYWEVPVIYPASLLYLVSGLCEHPEFDQPIVGMQRYHSAQGPHNTTVVREVSDYLKGHCVWAPEDMGLGRASSAERHGAFDDDEPTRKSLQHILEHGF